MFEATYGVALGAGLLAAVNPCGFALLPAYVSLLVAGDSGAGDSDAGDTGGGRSAAVGRALLLTGAMTLGFVAVFGGFGLLAAPAADVLARNLPWVTILIGVTLVGLGGWLLAGRSLPSLAPLVARGPAVTRRFGSMVLFGAAYAVASLGCTVGPFIAVVVITGFRRGSLLSGIGHFLAYAAGMALVVGAVALAVALTRMSVIRRLRRATPWLARAGGALLLLAGAYVAWYGAFELRVFAGVTGADPVIEAAGRVQSTIEAWLDWLGPLGVAAGFAGLLAAISIVIGLARRRRRQPEPVSPGAPGPPAPGAPGPLAADCERTESGV